MIHSKIGRGSELVNTYHARAIKYIFLDSVKILARYLMFTFLEYLGKHKKEPLHRTGAGQEGRM